MFKLFLYIVIAYLAYKIFANQKKLNPPGNRDKKRQYNNNDNDEFTDFEEIN
jgi:hypothetical protein